MKGKDMISVSELTGKTYEAEDCVFFRNCIQSAYYIEWGAELIDLFVGGDHKLVFVFSRSDPVKYRDKWGTKYNNKK